MLEELSCIEFFLVSPASACFAPLLSYVYIIILTVDCKWYQILEFPRFYPHSPDSIGFVIINFQKMSKI